MRKILPATVLLLIGIAAAALGQRSVHAAEMRFALVVGNDEYKTGKLATPANDAGLVADALQAAGFTVTGARNLDQATLRESIREFLSQVGTAGPDAVVLVYLAGYGLQYEGENYFVPVDADIRRDADVPLQAIRVSDFSQPLAALPARVKIVILDAARQNPFAREGRPLAGGLSLVEPDHGMAIAFNAAPGTVAPDEPGPYGSYATALTEMISTGGLGLDDLFARLRLRVSDLSRGAEVPWYASQIDVPFIMTERAADAPPPPNVRSVADIRRRPMRDFATVEDAYAAALDLDTLQGYEAFLSAYPNSPYSARVAGMVAVRREETIWRRCVIANSPQAYWSYLRRYPDGPHVWDARRRLAVLAAALEPPPDFAYYDFGVPPPPPAELVYVEQPVIIFVGPRFAPPPPPPLFFLPPQPREFVALPPPAPTHERFVLPGPVHTVFPPFVRPPPTVALRPQPGTQPGNHAVIPVALPNAVQKITPSPAPGTTLHSTPALMPPPTPPHGGSVPTPPGSGAPSTALVKPGTLPPQPGSQQKTTLKPTPLPSPPATSGQQQKPTTFKPSPPPPHPPAGRQQQRPTTFKPAPPPLPSGPPQQKQTTFKPAPMPPQPSAHLPPQGPAHQPPPPSPPHPANPAATTLHSAPPPPQPHPAPPSTKCQPGKPCR